MPKYKFGDLVYNITEKATPVAGDEELYIGLEHLDSGSLRVTRWGSKVALKGDKLKMREGDVLFGRRNTYLRRVAIAPHDGLFSAHGMIFRAKTECIDPDYLPFFLASDCFMEEAIRISVGSLSPTVNWKELKELEFTIPDLETQHKNAQTLLAANDLKEKYEELLAITDDLVKSQFIELFKGGQYPIVKAKDVCHFITKGTTPKQEEIFTKPFDNSIPYLKVYNLSFNGEMLFFDEPQYIDRSVHEGKLARSKVYPNDVLMNIVGPPLGKFALVNNDFDEWNINQAIAIFRAKENIHPKFLLHALMQPDVLGPFLEQAQGVRQLNFSLEQCRNLEFPLPTMAEQIAFVAIVEQTDKSKFEIKKAIENTSALIKSLMQQDLST